MYSEKTNT